jgi:hypothetical protein
LFRGLAAIDSRKAVFKTNGDFQDAPELPPMAEMGSEAAVAALNIYRAVE